ncbi:small-conductance mechanosensitive channel [Paenibacillus sp. YYML68]|uniref:small-conductance mechanosensitive channel n=1 Tax=Paenibacillus sp. YYML68 TaxID=2909250 RepID=UPI0024927112|nr:small-conductance mechanosensitive channel [Paenibacillus sp. YYML68]
MNKTIFLLLTLCLIFVMPLLGSLTRWGDLPPGYGDFPAQKTVEDPGFSLIYFCLGVLLVSAITLVYVCPKLFGFKRPPAADRPASSSRDESTSSVSYPAWFWWSLPVLGVSWFIMWGRLELTALLEPYTFVPLWWSFILILDGIVYKRNGGVSLISSRPSVMQLLGIVSCFSWFAFEYLNFFVLENWYYPNSNILTDFGNIFWFSLSYTTVLPAIIEWYHLLQTIPLMRNRYSYGPKVSVSRRTVMWFYGLGIALAFGMGYFPFLLFWVLWVALVPLLAAAMSLNGYWTPMTPIQRGNWSPILLIGLATLCNGFFWEFWNFGSEWFHDDVPTNPNYWKYSVPYLDKFHLFSEMPILGYYGYLFFGVNCWMIWLAAAYTFKFDASFELRPVRSVEPDLEPVQSK